ncbi:MAG: DUF4352 domain-containing protein [Anaerolineae bacterium]|nr:DUF4352 domain-containing protein [Anaerolineae bacterium]
MPDDRERLQQARQLIANRQYADARALLDTMPDNPTAQAWLAQLEAALERAHTARRAKRGGVSAGMYAITLAAALALIAAAFWAGRSTGSDRDDPAANRPPTVAALVSITPSLIPTASLTTTPTSTPTPTHTPTSTATPTGTPTPSDTPTPPDSPTPDWKGAETTPYYVDAPLANVRTCPSLACDVLVQVEYRDLLGVIQPVEGEAVGGDTGWLHLRINDNQGYIHASVTSRTMPPSATPTLTPSLTPTLIPRAGQLGPVTLADGIYTVQVILHDVRVSQSDGFSGPPDGSVYVIADVTIRNIGPAALRSISTLDFHARGADGTLYAPASFAEAVRCGFDLVDVAVGGSISGCVGFEVPESGALELLYAPYWSGLADAGQYLVLRLRE